MGEEFPEVVFEDTPLPNIIELKDISQTYNQGKSWVIQNFHLLIEDKPNQGQFIVILGPSGCGKSTILRYIAGLQNPTSGEVLIKGQPRTGCIPMVFQQYSNFPWLTITENVLMPLRLKKGRLDNADREKAQQIIVQVGLEEHADKYAQDTVLSGGQLQRVAIARSLLADSEILLMDEPFGALDAHTRLQMQLLLHKIWCDSQMTIIFVTHEIREAVFLGDDIYLMSPHPAKIERAFHVGLPIPRTIEMKHKPEFMHLEEEIEDALYDLIGKHHFQ